MPSPERLWTDDEIIDMERTVVLLRKMRTAAVEGLEPPIWPLSLFKNAVNIDETTRLNYLEQAEGLALSAAGFLGFRIAVDRKNDRLRSRWRDHLVKREGQFSHYPETTFARSSKKGPTGSLIQRMRNLHTNGERLISWEMGVHNQAGGPDISELTSGRTLVIAPLSGDYLVAAVYQAYLTSRRRGTFHLRGAALSPRLKYAVLPLEGQIPDVEQIGIFLDIIDTGKTGLALTGAIRNAYPQIPLLDQPFQRTADLDVSGVVQ